MILLRSTRANKNVIFDSFAGGSFLKVWWRGFGIESGEMSIRFQMD